MELFSRISTTLRNFDSESHTVEADSASLFLQTSRILDHMWCASTTPCGSITVQSADRLALFQSDGPHPCSTQCLLRGAMVICRNTIVCRCWVGKSTLHTPSMSNTGTRRLPSPSVCSCKERRRGATGTVSTRQGSRNAQRWPASTGEGYLRYAIRQRPLPRRSHHEGAGWRVA